MARVGDLVLIHHRSEPAFFARIEAISADQRPDWFHVRLLVLRVPPAEMTWILREEYIEGGEFTMGGEPFRIERIEPPTEEVPGNSKSTVSMGNKVVSLSRRKG